MRVVVERAEKRGEGNHELCGSERSLLANGYRIDFEASDERCSRTSSCYYSSIRLLYLFFTFYPPEGK